MLTHVDNLRTWFDHGRTDLGEDYLLIVHNVETNNDWPQYTSRHIFPLAYAALLREPSLIVLEIYDLHENREVQMWEHRAWHPPREDQQ